MSHSGQAGRSFRRRRAASKGPSSAVELMAASSSATFDMAVGAYALAPHSGGAVAPRRPSNAGDVDAGALIAAVDDAVAAKATAASSSGVLDASFDGGDVAEVLANHSPQKLAESFIAGLENADTDSDPAAPLMQQGHRTDGGGERRSPLQTSQVVAEATDTSAAAVEDLCPYALFIDAGGDPDDALSTVSCYSLWDALEPHVLVSSQHLPNKGARKRMLRKWKAVVVRSLVAHGRAPYAALFAEMARMDLDTDVAGAAVCDDVALTTLLGRPSTPPVATPSAAVTATFGFSKKGTRLEVHRTWQEPTTTADVVQAVSKSVARCKKLRARFGVIEVYDDGTCNFPPALAHLITIDASRLSGFLVKRHVSGAWLRALRRAIELINGVTTSLDEVARERRRAREDATPNTPKSRQRSAYVSPAQESLSPTSESIRASQLQHTPRGLPASSQQSPRSSGCSRSRQQASPTTTPRRGFVAGGRRGGAFPTPAAPPSLRRPSARRRRDESDSDSRPRYIPEPDVSSFVAHLHRRAVREGLV